MAHSGGTALLSRSPDTDSTNAAALWPGDPAVVLSTTNTLQGQLRATDVAARLPDLLPDYYRPLIVNAVRRQQQLISDKHHLHALYVARQTPGPPPQSTRSGGSERGLGTVILELGMYLLTRLLKMQLPSGHGLIADLAHLPDDWDSYGARAPTQRAMTHAEILLVLLQSPSGDPDQIEATQPFAVNPIPNGGIQLDWRGPGAEIQVDVGPDGTLGYLLMRGAGHTRTYEEQDDVTREDLVPLIHYVLFAGPDGR